MMTRCHSSFPSLLLFGLLCMCVVVANYSKPDLFVLMITLSFSPQGRFAAVDFFIVIMLFIENTCSGDMFNNNNSLFVANNCIPNRSLHNMIGQWRCISSCCMCDTLECDWKPSYNTAGRNYVPLAIIIMNQCMHTGSQVLCVTYSTD